MPSEMRTDQNTNPRRLRPTDGLLKPTQATVLHCVRRLYGHTPATFLLRLQNLTQLHRVTEHQSIPSATPLGVARIWCHTRSLRRRCALASLVYENVTRALWPIYGVADIDVASGRSDMVFCVADMVVADVVCGRYRRFPNRVGCLPCRVQLFGTCWRPV